MRKYGADRFLHVRIEGTSDYRSVADCQRTISKLCKGWSPSSTDMHGCLPRDDVQDCLDIRRRTARPTLKADGKTLVVAGLGRSGHGISQCSFRRCCQHRLASFIIYILLHSKGRGTQKNSPAEAATTRWMRNHGGHTSWRDWAILASQLESGRKKERERERLI